jgi:hypothetical protein
MKRMGTFFCSVLVIVIGLSVSAHAALVDMHDGTIYDTDMQLSWLKDAGAGGLRNWEKAVAWAASLNTSGGFAGLTGWRLPVADPTCNGNGMGWHCTNSEMGHLYYTELGNAASGPLSNTGPFINLQAHYYYWSGIEYAPNPSFAWRFLFGNGYQYVGNKDFSSYAWAVRPGARSQERSP